MKNSILVAISLALTGFAQAGVKQPVVFHEVDVQLTFWEAMNGTAAGPLAVPGSAALTPNIAKIKSTLLKNGKIKVVASTDWHLDYEVDHPEQFPEFKMFKAHGMAHQTGPVGAARIPEVENYPESQRVYIEHHEVKDGAFLEIPVNIQSKNLKRKILDPKTEVVIRKNGLDSYSVFMNPRTDQIYRLLNPKAVFVYGVATDFCVYAAVMGLLERGFKVYLIQDAIAGIFPEGIATKTKEMVSKGATLISTDEALKLAQTLAQ